MLGVISQPEMPPASLTGPVCTASIPTALEDLPQVVVASVPRNDRPGLVVIERGYAVNQTDAFATAARGRSPARVAAHAAQTEPREVTAPPRVSIDSRCSHSTAALLDRTPAQTDLLRSPPGQAGASAPTDGPTRRHRRLIEVLSRFTPRACPRRRDPRA